jgi:hypothetical protein
VAWERPIKGGAVPTNPEFTGVLAFSGQTFSMRSSTPVSEFHSYYDDAEVGAGVSTLPSYNLFKGRNLEPQRTSFDRFSFSFDLVARTLSLSVQPNTTGAKVPIFTHRPLPAGVGPGDYRLALGACTGSFTQTLDVTNFEVNFQPVPEPSTLGLLGLSTLGFVAIRRRRKK